MQELIQLLRQQLILLKRIAELMGNLKKMLRDKPSGDKMVEIVNSIEPLMKDMDKIIQNQSEICKKYGANHLEMLISAQQDSVEKYVALRLLNQINEIQKNLKTGIFSTAHLLDKENKFIKYNLNVLTQVKANPIYKPPGGDDIEARRGNTIFDASC